MNGLLRLAIIIGLGVIVGFALYLCAAALVLLHTVVPVWYLPVFVVVGMVMVVAYDELGPRGE